MYLKNSYTEQEEFKNNLSEKELEDYWESTQGYGEIEKLKFKSKKEMFNDLQWRISQTIAVNNQTEKYTSVSVKINLFDDWKIYDSGSTEHCYSKNSNQIIELIKNKIKGKRIKEVYVDDNTGECWLSSNHCNIEIYC